MDAPQGPGRLLMLAPSEPTTRRDPAPLPPVMQWLGVAMFTFVHTVMLGLNSVASGDRRRRATRIVSAWARNCTHLLRIRVEVVGDVPPPPHIMVANHQGHADIPAMLGWLPGDLRMIAKDSLFRVPVFGWGMRRADFISIDRGNSRRARESMERASRQVESGIVVVVFAEGTRTHDGRLGPFKKGAAVLALQTRADVVPIAIEGSYAVMPRGVSASRPGRIRLHVLPPVSTAELTYEDRDALTRTLRGAIHERLRTVGLEP